MRCQRCLCFKKQSEELFERHETVIRSGFGNGEGACGIGQSHTMMEKIGHCFGRNFFDMPCMGSEDVSEEMRSNTDGFSSSRRQGQAVEEKAQKMSDIPWSE